MKRKPTSTLRVHEKPITRLAPVSGFDPLVLNGGSRHPDSFVVLLAVVFNDLREFLWLSSHQDKAKPKVFKVNTETGDWQGAAVWLKRYVIAVLHELIVAVEHADRKKILSHPQFVRTLNALDEDERTAWANIVAAARGDEAVAVDLRAFFSNVRNRAAFHFDRGRIWEGYSHHFTVRQRDPFNERAYMSIGQTIGSTRFYFADAAAQQAHDLFDQGGTLFPLANELLKSISRALRAIVETHIRFRIADAQEHMKESPDAPREQD